MDDYLNKTTAHGSLPKWVSSADESLVPFDPGRISNALYEALLIEGIDDPFIARELTESILHFLSLENSDGTIDKNRLADLIESVLRELGNARVARQLRLRRFPSDKNKSSKAKFLQINVHASALPQSFVAEAKKQYALLTVFSADVVSAVKAGYLLINQMESFDRLHSQVLGHTAAPTIGQSVQHINHVSGLTFFNLLDHAKCFRNREEFNPYVETLLACTQLLETQLVTYFPTSGHSDEFNAKEEDLFSDAGKTDCNWTGERDGYDLLRHLLRNARSNQKVCLQLEPNASIKDLNLDDIGNLRPSFLGLQWRYGGDNRKKNRWFYPGLSANSRHCLGKVTLDLKKLFCDEQPMADLERYRVRVRSLAKLAVSAMIQKRRFLYKLAESDSEKYPFQKNFLLPRASIIVECQGLEEIIAQLQTTTAVRSGDATVQAKRILQTLKESLDEEAQRCQITLCSTLRFRVELSDWDLKTSQNDMADMAVTRAKYITQLAQLVDFPIIELALPETSSITVETMFDIVGRFAALGQFSLLEFVGLDEASGDDKTLLPFPSK